MVNLAENGFIYKIIKANRHVWAGGTVSSQVWEAKNSGFNSHSLNQIEMLSYIFSICKVAVWF